MVKNILLHLIQSRDYASLLLVFISYFAEFMTLLKLGARFAGSDTIRVKWIVSSIVIASIALFTKPFLPEMIFSGIIGAFIAFSIMFLFKPKKKIPWPTWIMKVSFSWVLLNVIVFVVSTFTISPLIVIFGREFFTTSWGIVVGTITEFIAPLAILLLPLKKTGEMVLEK